MSLKIYLEIRFYNMIKINVLFFLLTLFSAMAFSQNMDCSRFHEGKFRIADTRAGVVTIAERKGIYQIESSEALKLIVRFKIAWQNNCYYILRLDKVLRNENKLNIPSDLEFRVKIIETATNSYTQEISSSLTNEIYNVFVRKIY